MRIYLDPRRIDHYRLFLRIKSLPTYRIRGRVAEFPDEYAAKLGLAESNCSLPDYAPGAHLFDYQRDISRLAIRKQRFACFVEPGLGKTLIMLEFARYAADALPKSKRFLIVSPLMVVEQTLGEARRFYGDDLPIERIPASNLQAWLDGSGHRIGITNYESIRPGLHRGQLGGLALDESQMLKSMYGKWGAKLIEMGRGLVWKLSLTGTPAPNDRIEYANQAVFLDQVPTANAFLAKYFVNRGQTGERWELKPHALRPFYRSLSHWSIFVANPATYGWKDNTDNIPPINVHIDHVEMTPEQTAAIQKLTGELVATRPGGIGSRSKWAQIAKGKGGIPTLKYDFIRSMVDGWRDHESTIIWCQFNDEQQRVERTFPEAASIHGSTPYEIRRELLEEFIDGTRRELISKPKVLGLGLNLQVATRQVFSGLADSYEQFYQAVKRSNRVGSKRPLNVHIPVTEIERPMIETVLAKADRVQKDTEEQEALFREVGYDFG